MKFSFRYILAPALLLVSCAAFAGAPPAPTLVWRGDVTTANNFVNGMAKAWRKAGHPRITLQPFNTVSGIDALAKGSADIAGSVRGRAPRRSNEANLVFTPVAWDALAIITNHHNPVDGLTIKQLHDIYYGKITNWSQVGGKNEPIHVYAVASPTDGIEFSLRRLLFGRGNQPVAAPRLYLSVKSLQKAVALDPQSLAVSTLSNAHGKRKLKMLDIDGKSPNVANVADGSYPLYTPLYLVTRPQAATADTPKAKEISQFMAFAQSPAVASILHSHHLVPFANAQALSGHDDDRIAAIAKETGRRIYHHNGPTAAPGATYASRAAIAPTSRRTIAARRQMLAKRDADKAADVRAQAAKAGQAFDKAHDHPATKTTTSQTQVSWYTVVSGDTLSKIAQKKSVSVSDLREWNHIKGNLIRVGQKLSIRHD